MRPAHITRFQAEAAFDGTDADVSALQADVATAYDLAELRFDHVIEDVELELTADEHTAMLKFLHGDDQAHRTRRRTGRTALRSLPAVAVGPSSTELAA
jgi:hypothetical protein